MAKEFFNVIPLLLFAAFAIVIGLSLFHGRTEYRQKLAEIPVFDAAPVNTKTLAGKTAVVNFFASWCVPCEAEHPALTALSESLPVYGISFMDRPRDTDDFLDRLGNPFRAVGYDENGIAAVAWGVEGVPTTFVIQDGHILYRHDMPLTDADIDMILEMVK